MHRSDAARGDSRHNDDMRALLCVVTFAIAGCAATPSLVGKSVPPYPAGLQERSGVCLPASGGARDCQYSLSVLDSDSGGRATAVALEVVSRDKKGRPTWRVLDSAEIPDVKDGYSLEMQSCRVDRKKDEAVVAIVTPTGGKAESPWGNSYWAIRFDRKQKRFTTVPADKVECAGTDPNCL
jgi:hypothetical protein